MGYIGNPPSENYTSFKTETFSTSATTSYTLSYGVANENELALFINNVRQQPGSGKAYTATGTALTLSAATASTDTMYCVFLGRALQTVTPATNSITSSMVASSFPLGITVADQYRVTANITADADPISSNIERIDTGGQGTLGSAMSVSSGVFTFPSTGIYLVSFAANGYPRSGGDNMSIELEVTTDNSSFTAVAYGAVGDNASQNNFCSGSSLIDVTDTSNVKVQFKVGSITSDSLFYGSSTRNDTYFTFLRLGDT